MPRLKVPDLLEAHGHAKALEIRQVAPHCARVS